MAELLAPRCPTGALGWFGVTGRLVSTARILALILLAGCTPREVRPVRDAELATATANTDGNLVLVFDRLADDGFGRDGYLVYYTPAMRMQWQFAFAEDDVYQSDPSPTIIGGSALFDSPRGGVPHSILDLRLADATRRTLAPRIDADENPIRLGDDAAIFAIWHGSESPRGTPVEIAAFNPANGERFWTAHDAPFGRPSLHFRLDPRWLLYNAGYTEWQALRRSDGARVTLPAIDASGLCHAAGRWWGGRNDQLLALDLRGDIPTHRAVPAIFVPTTSIHQWSLTDCGERPGEVVLHIDSIETDMLVGVDSTTLTVRWTLDLPYVASTPWINASPPRLLGPTTIITNEGEDPCAIDLVAHRLLWCGAWDRVVVFADGEDVILGGDQSVPGPSILDMQAKGSLYPHPDRDTHLLRVRGSDATITAAVSVEDAEYVSDPLHNGKLWLRLADNGFIDAQLPLVQLDARTLRPVTPVAFSQTLAASRVRDAMPDLDTIFPRTPTVSPRPPDLSQRPSPSVELRRVNPWDDKMNGPADAGPTQPRPIATHDAIFGLARSMARLPADTPIRLLGWRGDHVVGFVETQSNGVTRWTLVRGTEPDDPFVFVRTFTRRPTEAELYNFLHLRPHRNGKYMSRPDPEPTRGATDEAAWLDLIGAPRTQTWLLQ